MKNYLHFPTERNHLSKAISYDLESSNTDRAKPHAVIFCFGSKIMGKADRDLTNEQIENIESDSVVIEDEDCISQIFGNLKK